MPAIPKGKFADLYTDPDRAAWDALRDAEAAAAELLEKTVPRLLSVDEREKLQTDLITIANNEVTPSVLEWYQIALDPRAGDLPVLRDVVARDLGYNWLVPDWRVALSYRELVRTRQWVKALSDARTAVVREDPCTFELITADIGSQATARYELTTWLDQVVQLVVRAVRERHKLRADRLEAPARYQVVRVLRKRVLDEIAKSYDATLRARGVRA